MIKAVIFDCFDVLVSDPFHAWLRKHGLARQGEVGELSRQLDTGKISQAEFFDSLSRLTGQPTAEVEKDLNNTTLDQAVVELIKKLREHSKLGLLSNANAAHLEAILQKHSIKDLFDVIVVSSEVGFAKPDAEIFTRALEAIGVTAHEAIFIDDQPANIVAARQIGLQAILFETTAQTEHKIRSLIG